MHIPIDLPTVHDFFAAADRAKLRIFHKERNHWGCNGYKCVEFAFASEAFLREANAALFCQSGVLPLPSAENKRTTAARTRPEVAVTSQLNLRPDSDITKRTPSASKIFYCGYPLQNLQPLLFPDFSSRGTYLPGQYSSDRDIILYGMHGGCKATYEDIEQSFKGTTLLVNGKPGGNIVAEFPHLKKFYQLGGPVVDTDRSMKVYYAIIIYAGLQNDLHQRIIGAVPRPTWNGKIHKLIYMQSHCVPYRQKAALELSSALALDVQSGGKCTLDNENVSHIDMQSLCNITHGDWIDNWKIFENYKYCLVMENTKVDGYIAEKLLLAFLGGCLPIYWETEEEFDIFNEGAFLYYEPGVTVMT